MLRHLFDMGSGAGDFQFEQADPFAEFVLGKTVQTFARQPAGKIAGLDAGEVPVIQER